MTSAPPASPSRTDFALVEPSHSSPMRTYEDQEFIQYYDRGGRVHEDLVFRKCRFVSSGISVTDDPTKRSLIRNVTLERCHLQGCTLRCAVVEDVHVHGLLTTDMHAALGTLFHRVTLSGKIGRLVVVPHIGYGGSPAQPVFDDQRLRYYAEMTDFALDISQAESVELDLSGIPARLIRRDLETQAVVTREAALAGEWRELEHVQGTGFGLAIGELARGKWGTDDVVLVADKRSRHTFERSLRGIEELRAAGVALPD